MATAARPASAGAGGAHNVNPRPPAGSRADRNSKLKNAHAAGRAGKPAPAWIDDAASQNAYLAGQADAGDAADAAQRAPAPKKATPAPTPTPAATKPASAPPSPPAAPSMWSGAPKAFTAGSVPSGDIAGGLLGVIAVAFMTNVIKGTWQQWLRAKFLNETAGTTRGDPNLAPGLFGASKSAIAGANAGAAAAGSAAAPPVPFVATPNPSIVQQLGALSGGG